MGNLSTRVNTRWTGPSFNGARSWPADTNVIRFKGLLNLKLFFGFSARFDPFFGSACVYGFVLTHSSDLLACTDLELGYYNCWTPKGYKYCFLQFIQLHAKTVTTILSPSSIFLYYINSGGQFWFEVLVISRIFFSLSDKESPSEQRPISSSRTRCGWSTGGVFTAKRGGHFKIRTRNRSSFF